MSLPAVGIASSQVDKVPETQGHSVRLSYNYHYALGVMILLEMFRFYLVSHEGDRQPRG